MAKQIFTNNAASALTTGVNTSFTTLVLSDASLFPSPTAGDYFNLALVGLNTNGQENSWEIAKCTARSGNSLTVIRAQEGTTAATWAVGTKVEVRVTALFANAATAHIESTSNPHAVTKAQVGLGSADNTADSAKAVATAVALAAGADRTKLDGIAANANNYSHPASDGNLHVPATSTTNDGKVLTAGATAGALSWEAPAGGVVQEFAASGTWTKPTGKSYHLVEVLGAGGGGGSGDRRAAGTQRTPGYGGGGGAMASRMFLDADLSASETVTVGAGGAGGAARTANSTAGSTGSAGGNSTFGSRLTGYGGGGAGVALPGGGGGVLGAGGANVGGSPHVLSSEQHFGGAVGFNLSSVYGGGGGFGGAGSGSVYGGGGGGFGGNIDTSNVVTAGVIGGYGKPDVGGAAGSSGSRPGVAGTGRAGGGGGYPGDTGGTIAGGVGGAGGTAAGGGGGGPSTNGANSGAGGVGGNGLVRVYSW